MRRSPLPIFWPLTICLITLLLQGCSHKNDISPYFKHNRYKSDINQYVSNPHLDISHESYGDIDFVRSKRKLAKIIAKQPIELDQVLFYGKTFLSPFYAYFVLLDAEVQVQGAHVYVRDTIINQHKYSFVGIPLEGETMPRDFDKLAYSFKAVAGAKAQSKESLNHLLNRYTNKHIYYAAMDQLARYKATDQGEKWLAFQMELTYASFLGDHERYRELLHQLEGEAMPDSTFTAIEESAIVGMERVINQLVKEAKGQQLIMVNENHFYPNHRLFLTQLLPALKAEGFQYLALEALTKGEEQRLNRGGDIQFKTGFYTKEQRFVELIKTAQQLGLQLISYESARSDREVGQAENLYANTFEKDPKAKVIVYAGISHILEKPDNKGRKWMATVFKEKYGIDPLTISQTHLQRYSKLKEQVCLTPATAFQKDYLKRVDYQLLNPLSLEEAETNFSYKNPYDYPVQISIFDADNKSKKQRFKVPIRAALLTAGEVYKTKLAAITQVQVELTNREGKTLKEEVVVLQSQ